MSKYFPKNLEKRMLKSLEKSIFTQRVPTTRMEKIKDILHFRKPRKTKMVPKFSIGKPLAKTTGNTIKFRRYGG